LKLRAPENIFNNCDQRPQRQAARMEGSHDHHTSNPARTADRAGDEDGACENPDEVVARALEIPSSEDRWLTEHQPGVAEKIDRAFAQFERGECFSADELKPTWKNGKGGVAS
jgi:hypothetical protein